MAASGSHFLDSVDRVAAPTSGVRAAAIRVVNQEPDADLLLDVLGLKDIAKRRPMYLVDGNILRCAICRKRVRKDGICRRDNCEPADGVS